MKIWLTKNSEVSIRDQLFEQISLGIATDDLTSGERLPSVRELARRLKIHPNTVSSAYQELAEKGLVEVRKGSGVYVRENAKHENGRPSLATLLTRFLAEALEAGFTPVDVQNSLAQQIKGHEKRKVAVIESDPALQKIVVEEIADGVGCEVFGVDPTALNDWIGNEDVVLAAMFDEREALRRYTEQNVCIIFLNTTSVPDALAGRQRPEPEEIVAVVSGWQTFLSLGRLFLIAANIHPDSILTRSTAEPNWQRGLETAGVVVADLVASKELSETAEPIVFRILSAESIDEVRQAVRVRI